MESLTKSRLTTTALLTMIMFGFALSTTATAATRPVFDVRNFHAKCDGATDDTKAIQSAEDAAARSKGIVRLPRGKCVISTGIALDSDVTFEGAGMNTTTLVASRNFGFDPSRVRRGNDGQYIGMLWLDGPTATGPLRNVTIRDLGCDPRAGTQSFTLSSIGTYNCIIGYMRPLQHFTLENVRFDLGANSSPVQRHQHRAKGLPRIQRLRSWRRSRQSKLRSLPFNILSRIMAAESFKWRSRL